MTIESLRGWKDRLPSPGLVVFGSWFALVLGLAWYVHSYATNLPYMDEWEMVPYYTGVEPVTLSWLWRPHNEHRIPLPKLVMLLQAQFTETLFLSGLILIAACLALLALGMILLVKRMRGYLVYADVFIPLLLLHWGHHETLLCHFQITMVVPVLLVCALLAIVVLNPQGIASSGAWCAALLLPLLPLCGTYTLVFVPGLALWFGILGVRSWGEGKKIRGLALVTSALLAVVLAGCYFLDYRSDAPKCPGVGPFLLTTTETMSTGLGVIDPYSGIWKPIMRAAFFVIPAFILCLLAKLSWEFFNGRQRFYALGFLMFMAGILANSAAVGWGRSFYGRGIGHASRYCILFAPLMCALYLGCDRFFTIRPATWSRFGLAGLAVLVYVADARIARNHGRRMKSIENSIVADRQAGMPLPALAGRHWRDVFLLEEPVHERLRMLAGHHANFRDLIPDMPPWREVVLDSSRWERSSAGKDAPFPFVIRLPEPRFLCGVRLTFAKPPQQITLIEAKFGPDQQKVAYKHVTTTEAELVIWVYDQIGCLNVHATSGSDLELVQVTLLEKVVQ